MKSFILPALLFSVSLAQASVLECKLTEAATLNDEFRAEPVVRLILEAKTTQRGN